MVSDTIDRYMTIMGPKLHGMSQVTGSRVRQCVPVSAPLSVACVCVDVQATCKL